MKQKDIFYLLVSSFIVIVIWIGANLWHIQNETKLSDLVLMQSTPINPLFDRQTLNKLKERSQATPLFSLKSASQSATLTPTPAVPTVSPTPVTSSSSSQLSQPL